MRIFGRFRARAAAALLLWSGLSSPAASQTKPSPRAHLAARAVENRQALTVYRDGDSPFNSGSLSGLFGAVSKIRLEPFCLDDSRSPTGCSTDPSRLDRERGTVLRVTFSPLLPDEFAGLNIEEPKRFAERADVRGYDLRGAERLVFSARSPNRARVRFGVGGRTTAFFEMPTAWSEFAIELSDLGLREPQLADVNILFTAVTNGENAAQGAVLLLDDIRFDPAPRAAKSVVGLPLANRTFGVLRRSARAPGRQPIPPDQVLRNLATIYESALVVKALLRDPSPEEREAARAVADALSAALAHDNSGVPLPGAPGARGLHTAYMAGELGWRNAQDDGLARRGDSRLAGFTAGVELCGPSEFCLVLDGATGGNNAFAIYALLAAFREFGEERYLNAATSIGEWIHDRLADRAADGFGGYFLGFPDEGVTPKTLIRGKSVENNADIFSAFIQLADIALARGDGAAAERWTERAYRAGDFARSLFDEQSGCFLAGTVPEGSGPGAGVRPDPSRRRGSDVVNSFLFLDANTFTVSAMAAHPRYRDALDWRRPIDCLDRFAKQARFRGREFEGFHLIETPEAGPDGIAWEFTAQAAAAMRFVDALYGESRFAEKVDRYPDQIAAAFTEAPFADGDGLPAATITNGDLLPPIEQCLSTPFQCIAQRVGIAATAWAYFAEERLNPLGLPAVITPGGVVNAAGFGNATAPGSIASVFGSRLAFGTGDSAERPPPTSLNGARLFVEDSQGRAWPAPIFFASPSQINFFVPPEVAAGQGRVRVERADRETAEHALEIAAVAPALFSANGDGRGPAAGIWVIVRADGRLETQFAFTPDRPSGSRAAAAPIVSSPSDQVFLMLFGTGIRGGASETAALIDGAPAPTAWVGPQGEFLGLDQVNLGPLDEFVGRDAELDLLLTVAGVAANPVTIRF